LRESFVFLGYHVPQRMAEKDGRNSKRNKITRSSDSWILLVLIAHCTNDFKKRFHRNSSRNKRRRSGDSWILLVIHDLTGTGWRSYVRCLSSWEIFRKRALYLMALLRKETCNLRHPMHLRHPVQMISQGYFPRSCGTTILLLCFSLSGP